jgi:hypothetical protein
MACHNKLYKLFMHYLRRTEAKGNCGCTFLIPQDSKYPEVEQPEISHQQYLYIFGHTKVSEEANNNTIQES